ncbi:MAG: ATP-binding protein [Veillonellales bacterium]
MLPKSLRGRLLMVMLMVVALPIIAAGYLMTISAERALVAEKQEKLFGAAHMLDQYLAGTYDDILLQSGLEGAGRQEKIEAINKFLSGYTDQVAAAYPGIGVGYYAKELDAIVTYGPSSVYADKVGMPISQTHEGRIVMQGGEQRVQEGDLVRGQVMNAMYPIIRQGKVLGYIWANELTSDIESQLVAMKRHTYVMIILGLLLGIGGIIYSIEHLMNDIGKIKRGLSNIKQDLNYQLPPLGGEVGEIANALNDMAHSLAAQKMVEKQVQTAERLAAIGEVAAGLAHEIRNPLMAIKGFAQLLGESLNQEEKTEYLKIISQEADRMNRLIEQLLCFARPAATEVKLVDVNEVLESTLLLIGNPAMHQNIKITSTLASDVPKVLVEGEQLKQVYLNLIINAIQSISQQGEVCVSSICDRENRCVCVAIQDNGSGIDPGHISRIFDPFFTTKEGGTGLGLAVAYRLMETWGGKITVESSAGFGSVFTLFFPVPEE